MTSASKTFWRPAYSNEIVVVRVSRRLPLGVGVLRVWLVVADFPDIGLHKVSPGGYLVVL